MTAPEIPEPVEPIDGAELLDAVSDWFRRFVCVVNDADWDLLALWAVHTHLINEVRTTPRLLIDSPVPGSGKTTCLEHLQRLAVAPVQIAQLSSPALLTRMLDQRMRTILIDEADRSLDPKRDGVGDLLAILNTGYKYGATRPVLVPDKGGKWDAKEMPTYSPVAIAGNSPRLPDDTRSRTVRVLLLPDHDGRAEESDWEEIEDDAEALRDRAAHWADQVRDRIRECRPQMPEGVRGRLKEKWKPLRRVADMAGGRWPEVANQLALADVEQVRADQEDGLTTERPAMVLLGHIAQAWPEGESFASSTALVDQLIVTYPEMWGDTSPYGRDLTVQRFGRMLSNYFKVNSVQKSTGDRGRGYPLALLTPVMTRMGIHPPKRTVPTARTARTVPDPHGSSGWNTTNGSPERVDGGCCPQPTNRPCRSCNPLELDGPGRCIHCGHHIANQGHLDGCPVAARANGTAA